MVEREEEKDGIVTRTLKILAYPVSAALGAWTMRFNVSDAAYDQGKQHDGIIKDAEGKVTGFKEGSLGDLSKRSKESIQTIFREAGENVEKGIGNAGMPEKINESRKSFKKLIEGRKKAINLGGFMEEWKAINRSQKQNAIINGLTITAVSLGALLAAANAKEIHHALFGHKDKDEPTR